LHDQLTINERAENSHYFRASVPRRPNEEFLEENSIFRQRGKEALF
jgi:hypothetical protein